MVTKRQRARVEAIAKRNDSEGFIEEFRRESDRATALLGAAYLDEDLLQLLTEFLVDDEDEVHELIDNERPLGAFGARIRAAYCLGLISKESLQDLKLIKAIRNEFAHQLHGLSFDKEPVASKCAKLKAHKRAKRNRPSSSREMFIHSTMFIIVELNRKIISVGNERRKAPPAPTVAKKLSE